MKLIHFLWTALSCAVLWSCNAGGSADTDTPTADTLTFHARFLTMAERPDGSVIVDVGSPWKGESKLGCYLLVHRDSAMPSDVPAGVRVIRTPVERAAVYSAVHTGAMRELGAVDALCAVADAAYFPPEDTVSVLLRSGKLTDVGNSADPSAELLVASDAKVVLRSPMQGMSSAPVPPGIVAI